MRGTLEERFWAKVDKRGPDECWLWKGSHDAYGYGQIAQPRNRGKVVMKKAHRLAWGYANSEAPKDLLVCHTCDNPACVNPGHLFLGTPADNVADMRQKNRIPVGEAKPQSKLTEEIVLEIRAATGVLQRQLAAKFGVCQTVVSRILRRKTWKHL